MSMDYDMIILVRLVKIFSFDRWIKRMIFIGRKDFRRFKKASSVVSGSSGEDHLELIWYFCYVCFMLNIYILE